MADPDDLVKRLRQSATPIELGQKAATALSALQQRAEVAEGRTIALEAALAKIRDFQPDFTAADAAWRDACSAAASCPECEEWRQRKHPIRRHCSDHYSAMERAREKKAHAEDVQHYAMRDIARAALSSTTAPAAPTTTPLDDVMAGRARIAAVRQDTQQGDKP